LVGEDDELSHEGGESEFFGFAASEETEVEGSKNRVVAGGDESSHVKDRADLRAATENVALSAELVTASIRVDRFERPLQSIRQLRTGEWLWQRAAKSEGQKFRQSRFV
jgi:hypothetical protein